MLGNTIIRAFDGSLDDAEGLLAVEKATFNESPHTAKQVQAMLGGDTQRAWLAIGEDQVIGFVVAFLTSGMRGSCWEIDLLAIHPDWTRRGLATRLIVTAAIHGAGAARRARAVVATDNPRSGRAFEQAGFHRSGRCELLIFRPKDEPPRLWNALGVTVREACGVEEVGGFLKEGACLPGAGGPGSSEGQGGRTLLLAESHDKVAGCAELSEVQTILYQGVWIESLVASRQVVRMALAHGALNHAAAAGLDEIGMMVPVSDQSLRLALQEAGFRSLGQFDWFEAELPMPGPPLPQAESERQGGDRV